MEFDNVYFTELQMFDEFHFCKIYDLSNFQTLPSNFKCLRKN